MELAFFGGGWGIVGTTNVDQSLLAFKGCGRRKKIQFKKLKSEIAHPV